MKNSKISSIARSFAIGAVLYIIVYFPLTYFGIDNAYSFPIAGIIVGITYGALVNAGIIKDDVFFKKKEESD